MRTKTGQVFRIYIYIIYSVSGWTDGDGGSLFGGVETASGSCRGGVERFG